ncbi:AAA family ATPase [Bacillus sp. 2205SS5-2]|uniref:AAA family ATPase n=1 Tax=Bacillus sp. 2205SS5-2 TaxID=3109031 RepID=UPI00300458B0
MYLSCVKIKNFRGYGENIEREDKCYVYDDLEAPLVIFKGYNGFGKTSFYEAIEWCLTDNVYRLEKFYDDKTYQVNELKKSHYLKFYHPIHGNTSKRSIYVELIFSNGLRIIRRSNSNILKTTLKDNTYKSTVIMGYGEDLFDVDNEKVLQKFISKAKNMQVFFHTHMLGQESISDFLRHNSPSKRREIFMQLLHEEELNSLYLKVQKYNNNGNALSKKSTELEKQINSHSNTQIEIEKFINNLGFSSIEDYLKSTEKHYLKMENLIKEKTEFSNELNINSLILENKINIENCSQFLQNVSFSQTSLVNQKENLSTEKEKYKRLKGKLRTWKLLNEGINILKKSDHASKLLNNNFESLQKKINELKVTRTQSSKSLGEFEEKLKEVQSKSNIFSSLKTLINKNDLLINEKFWDQLYREKQNLENFISTYQMLIPQSEKTINVDLNWFYFIRSRYNELQLELKEKNSSLDEIQRVKEKVSTLNSEYQKALSQVKKLLIENPDIDKCPVCLNEDFSYINITNEWEPNSSVSDKILSIIDATSSSGNEEINDLSEKENGIIEEVKLLQGLLQKEVINKLITKLDKIRNEYTSLYSRTEEQINKKIEEYEGIVNKQQKELDKASSKLNKLDESFKILFGARELKTNLVSNELKAFIKTKDDWFKMNAEKYVILNDIDSISDMENEISILKEERINEFSEEQLTKQIKKINDKDNFIMEVLSVIKEMLKLKLPVEYESSLKEFDQLDNKILELSNKRKIVEEYREEVSDLHGKLLGQQRRVVKERLEKHPIISWVYETINPHPFHKKLHITNTERGTNFIGETQLDDKIELYLDQMFSAAQLNILALSIFLGLGLTQRYSSLNQLFLDDPIQSMDDVNILALIDVIRAIMDSRYNDKHIVISTHNEDFAQLVSIKMRNRGVVQYNITGYTEEGPKIVKIT